MWIRRTDTGEMLNLKDCVRIRKGDWYRDDKDDIFYIQFEWGIGDGTETRFDSKEQRDNFYEHIQSHIDHEEIDPDQKPLKL